MGTEYQTTNELLDKVIKDVEQLIGWAQADHEGSKEGGFKEQARQDKYRSFDLQGALKYLNRARKP